jgi:hypothetical protein
MTETEWAQSANPVVMLEFLRNRGTSDRKLRLFVCACCHVCFSWRILDARSERAIALAERLADGEVDGAELVPVLSAARDVDETRWGLAYDAFDAAGAMVAASVLEDPAVAAVLATKIPDDERERQIEADLLRCIFGPLRVTWDPFWQTLPCRSWPSKSTQTAPSSACRSSAKP